MKQLKRITFFLLFLGILLMTACGKAPASQVFPSSLSQDSVQLTKLLSQWQCTPDTAASTEKETTTPKVEEKNIKTNAQETQAEPTKADKSDKGQAASIPSEKPAPIEPQNTKADKTKKLHCTLSVKCDTILDHMEDFNQDKVDILPKDGILFPEKRVVFYEGETVFDVLLRELRKASIHMEYESTPLYNSNYIEGIGNIYEFDCGDLSGWIYKVNGWAPNYGCSRYALKDGDNITWEYTCDLGRDVNGYLTSGEGQ